MRNRPRRSTRCSALATDRSSVAITLAAAWPDMISLARFGPVSAAAGCPGRTSLITCVMRRSEPCSSPFVRLTTGIHGWMVGLAACRVVRKPCEGTPMISTSAWATALSSSAVAVRRGGRVKPGR